MRCPKCDGRAYCYATKPSGTVKQRYRICRICGHKFSTWEEPEDRAIRAYRKSDKPQETGDLFTKLEPSK